MWEKMKECYWDLVGLFAWVWILFHLIIIAKYGQIAIYESNPMILYGEIVLCALILILGLVRTIRDFRGE